MKKTLSILLMICAAANGASANPLVVDPERSTVQVEVRANPPHHFTCDLAAYHASVNVDPETGTVTNAYFTFQLTDLDTHNAKRDKKLYGWMDTGQFNTIQWKLTSVEEMEGQQVAHGELQMHGVGLPVDVAFSITQDKGDWIISGVADLDYMEFELPRIRLLLFTVNPELHVQFTLRGRVSSS